MTDPIVPRQEPNTVEHRLCAIRGLLAALNVITEKMRGTQGLALSYLVGELESQFEAIDAVITEDEEELRDKLAPLVLSQKPDEDAAPVAP